MGRNAIRNPGVFRGYLGVFQGVFKVFSFEGAFVFLLNTYF